MPYTLPKGYLSWSAFKLYKQCPMKYRLTYLDGHREPPTAALVEGSAFHRGAEALAVSLAAADRTGTARPSLSDLTTTAVAAHRTHLDGEDPDGALVARRDGYDPLFSALARRLAGSPLKILGSEISLGQAALAHGRPTLPPVAGDDEPLLDFGGVPVKGSIDLHRGHGERRLVDDYKHTSKLWSDRGNRRYFNYDPRTDGQLTLYSFAAATEDVGFVFVLKAPLPASVAAELNGRTRDPQLIADVQARRILVEPDGDGRPVFVHWRAKRTDADVEALMDEFHRVASAISRGDFPLCREDALCRGYCAFRGGPCERGSR